MRAVRCDKELISGRETEWKPNFKRAEQDEAEERNTLTSGSGYSKFRYMQADRRGNV